METKFVLLVLLGASGYAQTGTFTATGNLNTGRFQHTATLLPNGKVLIAGGLHSHPIPYDPFFGMLASAELYDPSTGAFTETARMSVHRAGHTATLLANGKVLIVGGAYSNTAELYDPATETFSRTGDMITQRTGGDVATLLNDGRVLIAGGSLGASYRLSNAELYDPSTGTFAATGDLPSPFARAVGTLLPSGKVFVDGSPLDGSPGGAASLYDPAAGSFAATGARLGSVCYPAIGRLLPNGKILELAYEVYVDFREYSCLYQNVEEPAQLYDPATGTFALTGQIPAGCSDGGPDVSLPDGTVLFSWGDAVEIYDPVSGAFTCSGPMAAPSRGHSSSTLLADGTVLMAGGQDVTGNEGASAEIYSPPTPIPAPVLLSVPGGAQAAILHASTQKLVSSDSPAAAGEFLEIYLTGLLDGSVIPPQVAIGGLLAEVSFFGKAPGFAGLNQINIRVPDGVSPGPSVSVRLAYLGRPSNEVTIGVQ
jgi:hypothetical protein